MTLIKAAATKYRALIDVIGCYGLGNNFSREPKDAPARHKFVIFKSLCLPKKILGNEKSQAKQIDQKIACEKD